MALSAGCDDAPVTGLSTRTKMMVLGRVGLAAACLAAPDRLIGMLGFPGRSTNIRTFTRMLGVRDLAVALVLLASPSDRSAQRRAIQIALVVDVGDVLCIALGAAQDPAMRAAAIRNLPLAGSSALFSYLAARSI